MKIYYSVLLIAQVHLSFGMQTVEKSLLKAVYEGDANRLKYLVEHHKPNLEIPTSTGFTLLYEACLLGRSPIVEILLSSGADVNYQTADGLTSLHTAVRCGYKEIVKLIINYKSKLNLCDKLGVTALHEAVMKDESDSIQLLLEAGAPVDRGDNNGDAPLHKAAEKGNIQVVKLLLNAHAMVDAKNKYLFTPLHWAILRSNTSVAELLLDVGAQVDAQDMHGKTALLWAVDNTDTMSIELLLSFNAHLPNRLNKSIKKALASQTLLAAYVGQNNLKQVAVRLGKNHYPNKCVQKFIAAKRTELFDAVTCNDLPKVILFLKQGFTLHTCDREGNTLLHKAIENKSLDVVALLLSLSGPLVPLVVTKHNSKNIAPLEVALYKSPEALFMIMSLCDYSATTSKSSSKREYIQTT